MSNDKKDKGAIVKVGFHGDELEAFRDGDRLWVVARRVTEVLGIDIEGQRRKLNEAPWAVTDMISATGPDGKQYDTFCLELDCLPMWLATINPKKVRSALRPKLILYQKEAARVLRDAFFGPTVPRALAQDLDHIRNDIAYVAKRLEAHPAHCGRISDSTHATNKLKSAIQATAESLDSTFSCVHGEFRKEHKITGYRYLPLTYLDTAIEWLRKKMASTRVGHIARQLSLWPMNGPSELPAPSSFVKGKLDS